jgi:Rap1a immunity proteins
MRWIAIVSMMTGTLLTSAHSTTPEPAMTAEDLQQLCAGEDHVSRNACRIYILGVTQGISVGMQIAKSTGRGAAPCVSPDVSAETLERTVKDRLSADLKATPAHGAREAAGFVAAVLAAAFPCLKDKK